MIEYARVSTTDQNLNLQADALKVVGCMIIFADQTGGGSAAKRLQLHRYFEIPDWSDQIVKN